MQVLLDESVIPRVIGRGGSQIKELEDMLSIKIDVESRKDTRNQESGESMDFDFKEKGESIELLLDSSAVGKEIRVYLDNELSFNAEVGRKARVKLSKKSESGRKLVQAIRQGREIRIEF